MTNTTATIAAGNGDGMTGRRASSLHRRPATIAAGARLIARRILRSPLHRCCRRSQRSLRTHRPRRRHVRSADGAPIPAGRNRSRVRQHPRRRPRSPRQRRQRHHPRPRRPHRRIADGAPVRAAAGGAAPTRGCGRGTPSRRLLSAGQLRFPQIRSAVGRPRPRVALDRTPTAGCQAVSWTTRVAPARTASQFSIISLSPSA